jgi:hypothetical protein
VALAGGGDAEAEQQAAQQSQRAAMELEQFLLDNSRTQAGPVDVQEVRSSRGQGKYDTRISKGADNFEAFADVDVGGKKLSQLGARLAGQGRIGNYEVQYVYDPETKQPVITGAIRKELSPTSDVSAEGVYVPQRDGKDYYNAGVRYTKRFEDGGAVNKFDDVAVESEVLRKQLENEIPKGKYFESYPVEYVGELKTNDPMLAGVTKPYKEPNVVSLNPKSEFGTQYGTFEHERQHLLDAKRGKKELRYPAPEYIFENAKWEKPPVPIDEKLQSKTRDDIILSYQKYRKKYDLSNDYTQEGFFGDIRAIEKKLPAGKGILDTDIGKDLFGNNPELLLTYWSRTRPEKTTYMTEQRDSPRFKTLDMRQAKKAPEAGPLTKVQDFIRAKTATYFEDGGAVNKKEVGHPNEYADTVARWGRKGQEGFANMIGLGEEVKFANAIPEFYFPKDEQLDGRGDAMRHMLLQAQIAKKYGRTPAEIASYIHENWLTGGQSDEEQAMDEANDALGMDIGSRAKDKADMAYQALQAIKSGQAKTIAKPKKPKKFENGGEVTAEDIARVNRESYLSPTGVAPEIGEVKPKYPALNAWSKGLELAAAPFDKYALDKRIPLVGGMTAADFLGMNDTASLARDVSYGDPVVRGKSLQTSKIDPRLLAVADIVPVAGAAAKGATTLAKAGAKEVARQVETGTGVIGRNTMDPRMYAAEFYSPAARAVESHKMDKMPASQWMAWLSSNAPKAAKEELAQTEAGRWLKEQKGNVAKQDLLAVINESSPEILTKTMPQDTYAENAILGQKKAKFGDFTLPGNNSNYREMTLSLPFKEGARPKGYNVSEMDYGKGVIKYFANTPNTRSQAFNTREEAEAALQDSIVNLKDFRKNVTAYKVPSAHSYMDDTADTNRVAHIRMNDRQDRQGNSVLFVEEIQSDWAQQGRKEGFKKDFDYNKENELKKQYSEMTKLSKEAFRQGNITLFDEAHAKINALLSQMKEMENAKYSSNPPKGPYVEDTKAWTGLALKKIIEDAVDKGYSSVAFTTGAQQNARYNLAKKVASIQYTPMPALDSIEIIGIGPGGSPVLSELMSIDEIKKVYGDKIADTIQKGEGERPYPAGSVSEDKRVINNVEVEVGGRGMVGFYDEILPQATKDVLKQLGVKPEIKQIDMRPKPTMFSSTSGIPDDKQIGIQWGFDITPELMNAVQQKGISKFKHGGEVTDFIKSKK